MFNTMYQTVLLFLLLGGFLVPGVRQVSGIVIYTAGEVEAVNGTDVKLKCIFRSMSPVSLQSVTVSWSFQPLQPGHEEMIFYYQEVPYPPSQGRFKGHVVWSGDVMNKDASITLKQVSPTFNGTYNCRVLNRPDVRGRNGNVVLRVVNETARFDPFDFFMELLNMTGAGV